VTHHVVQVPRETKPLFGDREAGHFLARRAEVDNQEDDAAKQDHRQAKTNLEERGE